MPPSMKGALWKLLVSAAKEAGQASFDTFEICIMAKNV